jgi:hypothetical protein
MVNWVIDSQIGGSQPVTDTSTTARHPVGTIVRAHDADGTFGGAEFIYLKGIGSTVVGSVVTYSLGTFATALAPVGTGLPQPIAFAMSANVANQFGWYQISGIAVAKKTLATSLAANIAVGVKTIGRVSAAGTLTEILGCLVSAAASANTVSNVTTVQLVVNRPNMQGHQTIA